MKRYLSIIVLGALVVTGYGCHKKFTSTPAAKPTSKIKSGMYVWMGIHSDDFTEFSVTVINDSAVSVWGETLRYLRTDPQSHEVTFGYSHYAPRDEKTLSVDPETGIMKYSEAYYSSSGLGSQINVSTADYHRTIDLRPFVSHIQGAKSMSGTRYDLVWPYAGTKVDSTSSITATLTFTSLSDSTFAYHGVLDSGVLYYKKVEISNHSVVWQTHHTGLSYSTLTYNYSTNIFTFEQLEQFQNDKHYVRLQ